MSISGALPDAMDTGVISAMVSLVNLLEALLIPII
jgi:hypothetical protein